MPAIGNTPFINDANLQGYWPLNGNANDESSNTNNGTLQNAPSSVPGKFGTAYDFNGSTQYISIPDDNSLDITGALTILAWVKFSAPTTAQDVILTKGNNNSFGALVYTLNVNSNKLQFTPSNGTTGQTAVSSADVDDTTEWRFVGGVYVPSTRVTTYIDGQQDGENTTSIIASMQSTTDTMAIARDGDAAVRFFDGNIDDVAIFDRALGADEIKAIYLAVVGGNPMFFSGGGVTVG